MKIEGSGVIAPTINLNGLSADALIEGYTDALEALRGALTALREIQPHGRDYQTAPAGEYELARDQHAHRMSAMMRIMDEIEVMALAVQDQKR